MSDLDFSQLSDSELRDKLKAAGAAVGPITSTTRKLFEKKLRRLLAPENEDISETAVESSPPTKAEEKVETLTPELTGPVTYFGVALPPEKCVPDKAQECVFTDRKEALKFAKSQAGARFKEFPTKGEAVAFASTPAVQQPSYMPPVKTPAGESSAFKGPKVPELSKFKAMIEKGQLEAMYEIMWSNPRYLISGGDTPVILQVGCRYNALHICALKNQPEAAQLVLDTLGDSAFMARLYPEDSEEARDYRIKHIIDLYLNMPDKGIGEAPLHFACKFGNVEMVEFLVNCKHINLQQLNLYGETPKQIVCKRAKEKGVKEEILKILEATYFVPLMRPADKSSMAQVGQPWSPAKGQDPNTNIDTGNNIRNNNGDPTMSPLVLHAYAGPMPPSQAQNFRKKWMQHTSQKDRLNFLSICCKDDEKGLERIGRMLAKEEGLKWNEYWDFLEDYVDLSSSDGLRMLDDYLEQVNHDVSINISTYSDSPLPSPPVKSEVNEPEVQKDHDNSFTTLLGSLDNQFSKLRINSPSPPRMNVENIGVTGGDVDKRQGSDIEMRTLDFDDMPQFCDTTKDGQGNFRKTLVENVGVIAKHAGPVCDNALHDSTDALPVVRDRAERGSEDTEFESCDSESDTSVNTFYTAADDVCISPPYNLSSPLPEVQLPVFLLGTEPSKFDTDVLHALGDHPITPEFPNVVRWRKHVAAFTEEARNSWTSPRRDQRLNLSLGSPLQDQSLSITPRPGSCSRLSAFITPKRVNARLMPGHTPTLQNKDTVRTNLNFKLDI